MCKENYKIAYWGTDLGRDLLSEVNRIVYITIEKVQKYLLLRYLELQFKWDITHGFIIYIGEYIFPIVFYKDIFN